jgi:hypothetical protein
MTTYTWVINEMNVKPSEGNLQDVVININWTRSAVKEDNTIFYYCTQSGQYFCSIPSGTDFTPYEDLTFDQVCGWLDEGMDVPVIDSYLDTQIELQINPPVIVLPLPWETPNI